MLATITYDNKTTDSNFGKIYINENKTIFIDRINLGFPLLENEQKRIEKLTKFEYEIHRV